MTSNLIKKNTQKQIRENRKELNQEIEKKAQMAYKYMLNIFYVFGSQIAASVLI